MNHPICAATCQPSVPHPNCETAGFRQKIVKKSWITAAKAECFEHLAETVKPPVTGGSVAVSVRKIWNHNRPAVQITVVQDQEKCHGSGSAVNRRNWKPWACLTLAKVQRPAGKTRAQIWPTFSPRFAKLSHFLPYLGEDDFAAIYTPSSLFNKDLLFPINSRS